MGFNGRNVMKTKNKEKIFLSKGIEIQFFFIRWLMFTKE